MQIKFVTLLGCVASVSCVTLHTRCVNAQSTVANQQAQGDAVVGDAVAGDVQDVQQWTDRVATITRRADSSSRGDALSQVLLQMGLTCKVETFESEDQVGRNLIVDLPVQGDRLLVIGAHYDQVPVGQGVVDNGSSCAAIVELIERLKTEPLSRTNLQFAFFDLEEKGLLGSIAHVQEIESGKRPRPDAFINLDIFGYGDAVWLMSNRPQNVWTSCLRDAFKNSAFQVVTSPMDQYPPSDHVPFEEAGISTVAFALIDEPEIDLVRGLLTGQRGEIPPILQTIHTPNDSMQKLDAQTCVRALDCLETSIRAMDRRIAAN